MSATFVPFIGYGDLVLVRTGGVDLVAKVMKVNRTKLIAMTEDGKRYEMRIDGARRAPEGSTFTEPEAPDIKINTHVRFKPGTTLAMKVPGLLFVTDFGRAIGSWKVAIVGQNRYYRDVPAHELEPVEVEIKS